MTRDHFVETEQMRKLFWTVNSCPISINLVERLDSEDGSIVGEFETSNDEVEERGPLY